MLVSLAYILVIITYVLVNIACVGENDMCW